MMNQATSLVDHPYPMNSASTSSCSYANGYPSGTQSECASPGPMQRFRNVYQNELNENQNVNYQNAQPGDPYSQPYANQWLNMHCRGGYRSASGSRPASVMSTMSSATIASNFSTMSGLSVITNVTEMERSLAANSVSSENVPIHPSDIDAIVTNCNAALRTTDSTSCLATVTAIQNHAKNHALDYVSRPSLLKELCSLLLYQLYTAVEFYCDDETIRLILETIKIILHRSDAPLPRQPHRARIEFLRFMQKTTKEGVDLLIRFLVPNKVYTKFALRVIQAFFAIPPSKVYPSWRQCLQNIDDIVGIFLRVIQHELQTHREIALNCLIYIVKARHDLKIQLCHQQGLEIVLELLQKDAEEPLFYRAALLLKTLLNSSDHGFEILNHFISLGGVTVCAKHLGHGSPRLLRALIECIKVVSDLPETTTTPTWIWENLDAMLRVIGSADFKLNSDTIACLANMAVQNHCVKQYLVTYNAPSTLVRMLFSLEDPKFAYWPQAMYDELMDNTLWALQTLISTYKAPVPNCAPQACLAIVKSKDWNLRLVKVLAEGLAESVNRALLIIRMVITHCPEAIQKIETTTFNNYPMSYYFYLRLSQAIELLVAPNTAVWDLCRLYRCPFSASVVEKKELKKSVNLMITRAFNVIFLLIGCDDKSKNDPRSSVEFDRIFEFIKNSNVTPFHWLGALKMREVYDEHVKSIFKLGHYYLNNSKVDMARILLNHQIYQDVLYCCSCQSTCEEAHQFLTAAQNQQSF